MPFVFLRLSPGESELVYRAHQKIVILGNFDDIGRFDTHMRRKGRLLVLLGRGKIVDQPIHTLAAVILEGVVETVAGLAAGLHTRPAAVIMADVQQF